MSRLEKTTDLIVFSMLRKNNYVDGGFENINMKIPVWAKKSSNKKINDLLKFSSKSGSGNQGFPEYIILDEENDIIIVIENKKDTKKHIWPNYDDNIKDYAVNGALWYAKHLSIAFHVIAIGISGNSTQDIIIDSFLWKKEAESFNNLNLKQIYPISKYRDIISSSGKPKSNKEIIIQLNDKSKEINEFLRDILGIIEHERLYLLGSILYALEDPIFKMSYNQTNNNKDLSNFLYSTVERKIKGSNVREKDIIIDELKPVLLGIKDIEKGTMDNKYPNGSLFELVSNIDNTLLEFHKNREIDLMSTFFNVFLSYSTSGGSDLGIVLTPPHITQLFSDLANITLQSKVLDICVGTGGFLTSAWRKIALDDSFTHTQKEKFRNNNIVGVEIEKSIYSIVALNMFINKDGRSNLFYGDAFKIQKELTDFECNVGFVNPPYSDGVYSELSFVELMLDCLLPNSIGIAIIPVNAVSDRTKKHSNILEVKKRILLKNTLLSSIQMPKNLFYPKGTETIILVFKTGIPNETETWLAKYDDSYELIKHKKTRTPSANSDNSHVQLIEAYKNNETTDFSFSKYMKYSDQWVYTVHDDFNYSINQRDLQKTLNDYISYLYSHNYK